MENGERLYGGQSARGVVGGSGTSSGWGGQGLETNTEEDIDRCIYIGR
jgi:hypothetical protein